MEILGEILLQLITVSTLWYLLELYVITNVNKYFKFKNIKLIETTLDITSSVIFVGLQTHLIEKLEYITQTHPFRFIKLASQ